MRKSKAIKSNYASKRKNCEKVYCPVCQKEFLSSILNIHLDGKNGCLSKIGNDNRMTSFAQTLTETKTQTPIPRQAQVQGQPKVNVKFKDTKVKSKVLCPCCNENIDCDIFSLHFEGKTGCLARSQVIKVEAEGKYSSPSSSDTRLSQTAVPGLYIIEEFITKDEEKEIIKNLDNCPSGPWKFSSFNGKCMSRTYGFKTQFGKPGEQRLIRRNDVNKGEPDIPHYLGHHTILKRLYSLVRTYPNELQALDGTVKDINECNANSYNAPDHFLRPHFDDRFLSGPFLVNLSMGRSGYMTYSKKEKDIEILLPRRCLQIVTGPSRWDYMHEIKEGAFLDDGSRRVSVTWRCAGSKKGVVNEGSVLMQRFLGQKKG
jgi:alkylated DNA repair dioxygenase AlkB